MANEPLEKKENCAQAKFLEMVVIKNQKMKPFLNVFSFTGQNTQQQKLGEIFGIIQVDDNSKSSAYLPNMLTQILKREYFKRKNKNCGKSFELALHKINITLTELAQHEIVKWMNNLNVAVGVICGNKIHFAQIGKGRILFLKNKKILTITNTTESIEEYHPMKTFSSISAGKIEAGNKLIFTLKETFKTLDRADLERHFKTFNSDEFDNIVSSTLRNEAFNTGIIVINIEEANLKNALTTNCLPKIKAEKEDLNFFGETKLKNKKNTETTISQKKEIIPERKIKEKSNDPNKSPFENEPEIYFKETEDKEKTKQEKTILNKKTLLKEVYLSSLEKIKIFKKKKLSLKNIKGKITENLKKIDESKIIEIKNRGLALIKKINFKKTKKDNILKISFAKEWITSLTKTYSAQSIIEKIGVEVDFKPKEESNVKPSMKDKTLFKMKKLALKIKMFLIKLSKKYYPKKSRLIIIAIAVLLILIISIFFIFKIKSSNTKSQTTNNGNIIPTIANQSTSSINNLEFLINLEKGVKNSTFLGNELFLLTENRTLIKFSVRDNTKTEIILPKKLKNPKYLSAIESLQLVLITSEEQVYSYSPVTNSFAKNAISMPDDLESIGAGTYLTYLYLLDKKSNQIYRYSRAPGGFALPKKWLAEEIDFKNALDIDINDSIYVAFNNGKIQKYFHNKREKEYSLEEGFIPNEIKTKINKAEIFALDKNQGKIIKLLENGTSQKSFQDKKFKNARDFSVDFENNKIFIITRNKEILMFNYQ